MTVSPNLDIVLDYPSFLRSITVAKSSKLVVLLGAGASVSSGIQSASDCIWDWKKQIYVSHHPPLAKKFSNHKDPSIQEVIQAWLNQQGRYSNIDLKREYSFYAEEAYPDAQDRRLYFESLCKDKMPSIGYSCLSLLAKLGYIHSVWTTNFDGLAAKSAGLLGLSYREITTTNSNVLNTTPDAGTLLLVNLHGDYKYGELKNTEQELDTQEEAFKQHLKAYLKDKNLLVIGYSGRDKSLMDALGSAYAEPGAGRIYWCGRDEQPSAEINSLLTAAKEVGRSSYYTSISGFDELQFDAASSFLSDNAEASSILEKMLREQNSWQGAAPFERFNFQLRDTSFYARLNRFPVSPPASIWRFKANVANSSEAWAIIKDLVSKSDFAGCYTDGYFYAFCDVKTIDDAFTAKGLKEKELIPLQASMLSKPAFTRMLNDLIIKIVARVNKNFLPWRDGVRSNKSMPISVGGKNGFIHNYFQLGLTVNAGKCFLSITTSKKIFSPDYDPENGADKAAFKKATLDINSTFKNPGHGDLLDKFVNVVLPSDSNRFNFPTDASPFTLSIDGGYRYASFANENPCWRTGLFPDNKPGSIVAYGRVFKEADLLFTTREGREGKDYHPLRGLLHNAPYDSYLNINPMAQAIKVGVICTDALASKMLRFLDTLNSAVPSTMNGRALNEDYLVDYPGFRQAFQVSLDIPRQGDQLFATINCPTAKSSDPNIIRNEILQTLRVAINSLSQAGADIIVVGFPENWEGYKSAYVQGAKWELHDYVKAYCADLRKASQVILEKTLSPSMQGQVQWWLAQSFYAKSFRTPFVLANSTPNTAFIGIGFGIKKSENGSHTVLGCSHLYNSRGEGMKYELRKIDAPDFFDKRDNPYLKYEDAYRVALGIRRLTSSTTSDVIDRVVIHKRTRFTDNEIRGFTDGLKSCGIKLVDLIELKEAADFNLIRYNYQKSKDEFSPAMFPVWRGLCLPVGNDKAILYTHGSTISIKDRREYTQGGKGLPRPMMIVRHAGSSSLEVLAREILGLTKMNLNNGDLYTHLPATIDSANKIAAIGSLLSARSTQVYDYRLFI